MYEFELGYKTKNPGQKTQDNQYGNLLFYKDYNLNINKYKELKGYSNG